MMSEVCRSVLTDDDGKSRECGAVFELGSPSSVEHACSLECWLSASAVREFEERKLWDVEYYGYHNQSEPGDGYITWEAVADPLVNQPDLYRYKGWTSNE